jgi:hypothetical protein
VVVRFLRDARKPLILVIPSIRNPRTKHDEEEKYEEDDDDENQNETRNRCLLSVIPPNRRKAIFFRQ